MMSDKEKRFAAFVPLWFLLLNVMVIVALNGGLGRFLLFSCFPQFELRCAIGTGDIAAIDHAVSRGANVDDHYSYAGRTPLMVAAIHGQTKMAVVLIARGADVNARDDKGNTAFQLAQKEKHFDTAALLKGH